MQKSTDEIIIFFTILAMAAILAFAGWKIKRWFNYHFSYQAQVEETINKMVKKECLNDK